MVERPSFVRTMSAAAAAASVAPLMWWWWEWNTHISGMRDKVKRWWEWNTQNEVYMKRWWEWNTHKCEMRDHKYNKHNTR